MRRFFMGCALAAASSLCGAPLSAEEGKNIMQNETVVLGGGCFWCVEAVLEDFRGVNDVVSGYSGGAGDEPTYEDVSGGDTGHAEVVEVAFDPKQIELRQILKIFFHSHDPTTKDRQGYDVGSQYRSVIFFKNEEQKRVAEEVKAEVERSGIWGGKPVVTEVKPLAKFFPAEGYHQDYFKNNPSKQYCQAIIGPKVQKVRKEFKGLLRET